MVSWLESDSAAKDKLNESYADLKIIAIIKIWLAFN